MLRAAALPVLSGVAGAGGSYGASWLAGSAGLGHWAVVVIAGVCGIGASASVLALDPMIRAECVRLLESKLVGPLRAGARRAD